MRTIILALSAATLALPVLPAAPAFAHGASADHSRSYKGRADRGRSYQGREIRVRDERRYCRKPNGTTGLIVGGAAGALVGREVDSRGSRTTGTVLGAALGALLGRHVQRNVVNRCR
jgi:uncharacterized protein YcfJ